MTEQSNKTTTEQIRKYRKRFNSLARDRQSYEAHWRDLRDYVLPRTGKYLSGTDSDRYTRGDKKHQKVINARATKAHGVAVAGLIGGFTSPSRPWFRLGLADVELNQYAPVKEWLSVVRDRLLEVFARSNFYGATTSVYSELIAYGTGVMIVDEDFTSVIRCRPLSVGEYYLALNSRYRPDTLYRRMHMTARQMVQEFGINRVSSAVKNALANDSELEFSVIHCIQPRNEFDPNKQTPDQMPWESVYYEETNNEGRFLRISGYSNQSFMAPRWGGLITNAYGDSPGMDALADIKMLQRIETNKIMGLDKAINPPLNAPASMKIQGGVSVVPGGVNYYPEHLGQTGSMVQPAYTVNPYLQESRIEIDAVENRIREMFFNDIFLAIIAQEKTMTAREVAERSSEKLTMLGPVLDRIQAEYLDVCIDRAFYICLQNGLFPPIPDELRGQTPKIEYISILAQAQKMIGVNSIQDTVGFISGLMQIYPEAGDKLNVDECIDEYAEMVGPPPRILNSDEAIQQMRQQRAMQQAQMQAQAQAAQNIEGAKSLSQMPLEGGNSNALEALLGGIV